MHADGCVSVVCKCCKVQVDVTMQPTPSAAADARVRENLEGRHVMFAPVLRKSKHMLPLTFPPAVSLPTAAAVLPPASHVLDAQTPHAAA
jgi:hypothetical protein